MKKILLFNNSSHSFVAHRQHLFLSLVNAGHKVEVILPETNDISSAVQSSGTFHTLNLSRQGANPFKELRALVALYKIVNEFKPDLIHNFTIKCILYGTIVGLFCRTNRIVNSITGMGYVFTAKSFKSLILRKIISLMYRFLFKSDRVFLVFQNSDDAEYLTNLIRKKRNHSLIYGSGVDTDFYKRKSAKLNESSPVVIACTSRLLTEKGIHTLVKAFQELQKETLTPVECKIAGTLDAGNPGSLRTTDLENYAKIPNLYFVGQLSNVKDLLEESDIFCLPSYREGLPMSILEAESMELPVVTTNAPGCRETVIHGNNGFLVPIDESKELSKCLKTLVENPELRRKFGQQSRIMAVEAFSKEIVLRQIYAMYSAE